MHNQRIERHGEMFSPIVPFFFYNLFHYMESKNLLDIDNELHMFCLHYIFRSRIDNALQMSMHAWNNHPLSTEGNLSPTQLWIHGLASSSQLQTAARDDITEV